MLWQSVPSVVIGKHQRLRSEVDKEWAKQHRIAIARRFSGGGAVYHDLGNVNFTFIETVSRLPEFVHYLQRTLDFLSFIGIEAKGDERLGIYLNGLKISGSAQCVHKDRVLYHCTLLYDTDLTILNKVLNPDVIAHDGTLSSVYAVPSIRSEVTNIGRYLPAGSVDDFKENAFQYFSESQSVSSFSVEEKEAVNRLRSEKYIREEWIRLAIFVTLACPERRERERGKSLVMTFVNESNCVAVPSCTVSIRNSKSFLSRKNNPATCKAAK